MRPTIEEAANKLEVVKGELTAAVLFIPVALTFQDFAHALAQGNPFLGGPLLFALVRLGLFLLLSVISVGLLSLGILHFMKYGPLEKGVLLGSILIFVVGVAYAGALASATQSPAVADDEPLRFAVVGLVLPICLATLFLFKWDRAFSEPWVLYIDILILVCVVALSLS